MIAERTEINVAREFTDAPGPRKRSEGDHSGEEFLANILRPRFVAAREGKAKLFINLDGAIGYPTSFLEEAFGGLARAFGPEAVEQTIEIICHDEPYLEEQIWKYVRAADGSR